MEHITAFLCLVTLNSTMTGGDFKKQNHQQKHKYVENVALHQPQKGHLFTVKSRSVVQPQLGMYTPGDSKFSLLCTCPPMTGAMPQVLIWGYRYIFMSKQIFKMDSSNNEDQLY